MNARSPARTVLLAVFMISGVSGLIYESIWSHYLKLFLGHAAYSQTLVLAIFMGGMSLGSWLIARWSARIRSLLIGYAIVELLTGILALLFHRTFVAATSWAFDSLLPGLHEPSTIQIAKWSLASALILPQSILLGMTFPLMSGAIVRSDPRRSGETLAMLYFTNSFGAACGVLLSGFVLIGRVGLPGTVMTAGLLNVAIAGLVWLLWKRQNQSDGGAAQPPARENSAPASLRNAILLGAAVTGAAAFFYEIAWIRMLSLVLGSSTHSFELMLSAFILGIALGGLWVHRRIDALSRPLAFLGRVLLAMSLVALASLVLYGPSFDVMALALRMFTPTEQGYAGFHVVSHAIALVLMIPTTFFCGMTLPVMTQVLLRAGAGEQAIGAVYSWNTVGSILGVVVAVHLLMPWIGVKGLVMAGASLHALAGAGYLYRDAAPARRLRAALPAAALFAVALVLAGALVTFDPLRLTSGVYRTGRVTANAGSRILYFRHGKTASISLIENQGYVGIATNGKPDATIAMQAQEAAPDEITMTLAGVLPLALHTHPARIANIGIGSGLTSHVLLTDPRVQTLDTIEIEPLMAEAARFGFMPRVRNAFTDPRSHIYFEDAKTFFATHPARYDVIVSEPSNPWVSGVATLFSDEFYAQLTRYLAPDGMLLQWVQVYETDTGIVSSIIRALAPHFADFALYHADDGNIIIVATRSGKVGIPGGRIFENAATHAELQRVGLLTLRDVQARFIAGRDLMLPLALSYRVPANSDYFPYVDLNAIRARITQRNAVELPMLTALPVPLMDLLLHT